MVTAEKKGTKASFNVSSQNEVQCLSDQHLCIPLQIICWCKFNMIRWIFQSLVHILAEHYSAVNSSISMHLIQVYYFQQKQNLERLINYNSCQSPHISPYGSQQYMKHDSAVFEGTFQTYFSTDLNGIQCTISDHQKHLGAIYCFDRI